MRRIIYPVTANMRSIFVLILCVISSNLLGQISHGGSPLPLSAGQGARALSSTDLFIEMPAFNVQEAMWRSEQGRADFKSLEFAHKFDVFLRPDNSGINFIAGDMNVWRVGIRSKGAYSLNIIFSKFNIPAGARLFVYNADQTEVLGSYTHENNSDLNILPVQPIGGDELIVEYQVPIGSAMKSEIEIGEVNHDYMGIFRANDPKEPRDPSQNCHPNLVCYPEDIEPGSGVVALIINGDTYCTGVMVNNSAEDGTPYLLTNTHCLNNNYNASFLANKKYDIVAGSIVAFFNYNSPSCSTDIRGPIQMSVASADSVLISERHDISLLKLKDAPPKEYQPYYLGWNAGSSLSGPFHGIHHPNGGIKKVAIDNERPVFGSSFTGHPYYMEPNSHWVVRAWDTGATESGSSGSPLLDGEKRIVGTLSGGESFCSSPKGPDVYASLNKFWNVEGSIENPNSIKFYLDPIDSGSTTLGGFDPYEDDIYTKRHNYKLEEKPIESYFESVPMFATNNSFGYTEFAEEYRAKNGAVLEGVFISSPATSDISQTDIRIRIYSGDKGPATLLYEFPYRYSYRYYSDQNFATANRDMKYNVENYIKFDSPITVSGSFYISYRDVKGSSNGFSVFNAEPRKIGSGEISTSWMRNSQGWVNSSENIENPVNTSLYIAPYLVGDTKIEVEPEVQETIITVYYSGEVKRIFIESNDDLLEWEIYYITGQKIHQESADISIGRASYSASHLIKGVYLVKVKTINGSVEVKKVLVI